MVASIVHHFSEDPSIARFEPHIPKTNLSQPPAVWAIDPEHSPLYWFPRNCPRVTAWPRNLDERAEFRRRLATNAPRVHAIETTWLDRVRTTQLYRYDFDASDFAPWPEASGQWISREASAGGAKAGKATTAATTRIFGSNELDPKSVIILVISSVAGRTQCTQAIRFLTGSCGAEAWQFEDHPGAVIQLTEADRELFPFGCH